MSNAPGRAAPERSPEASLRALAEAVRDRCVQAALAAYEDAGLRGLCAEGRWEAVIGALRSIDPATLLRETSGERPPG